MTEQTIISPTNTETRIKPLSQRNMAKFKALINKVDNAAYDLIIHAHKDLLKGKMPSLTQLVPLFEIYGEEMAEIFKDASNEEKTLESKPTSLESFKMIAVMISSFAPLLKESKVVPNLKAACSFIEKDDIALKIIKLIDFFSGAVQMQKDSKELELKTLILHTKPICNAIYSIDNIYDDTADILTYQFKGVLSFLADPETLIFGGEDSDALVNK